eukprot:jgi/Ulvmu1/295/UM001_0299.1
MEGFAGSGSEDVEDGRSNGPTIDVALEKHIGELGRHQIWLFSIVSSAWMPGALMVLNMAFFGKDPIKEHLWECIDPDNGACAAAFDQLNPAEDFCALPRDAWRWTHPSESVRSDFGLFCDSAWLLDLSNSAFFLGFLFGAAGWGIASDSIGRFGSLIGACILSGAFTALTAAVLNYHWFVILRILSGASTAGMGLVSFTLACEIVGASWRGIMGIASQLFWCTGACIMPLIAWLVPQWRPQTVVCGASILPLVLIMPFFPESPRWLLAKGRHAESTAVLTEIAARNGTSMPDTPLAMPAATAGPPATLLDTFRARELRRRMCIMMACWFIVSLAYYGVSLALEALEGSLYLNFFLISLIEYPSYFVTIALINRLGRRRITIYAFLICGLACMLCAAVPAGEPGSARAMVRICAAVLGKFGAAAAFALLFVFTTELFPTVVRNAALGANSAAARIGGVVAPLIVLLAAAMHAGTLSFAVFGLTSFVAGLLMISMPETQGQPLPETIEEVETAARRPRQLVGALPISGSAAAENGEAARMLHQEEQ